VVWGGVLSGFLYIATTLTLLIAVSRNEINVLQGIVQAVSHMAAKVGVVWIVAPFALMLSISIAGIGSAWLAGSARIPFVAGLDSYLPNWLGKVHPRYGTPYAALIVHFVVSTILVLISFLGSGVQETFQRLLSLAVVLQLLPFLYIFAALLKIAANPLAGKGHYNRSILWLAGSSGLLMTILGMIFAFSPAQQITSVLSYESWMFGGTAFFIGLAVFFFFVYGRRKSAARAAG
jgi:amino acid transporter